MNENKLPVVDMHTFLRVNSKNTLFDRVYRKKFLEASEALQDQGTQIGLIAEVLPELEEHLQCLNNIKSEILNPSHSTKDEFEENFETYINAVIDDFLSTYKKINDVISKGKENDDEL